MAGDMWHLPIINTNGMSCLPAQFTNQRVGHTNFWRVGRHPINLLKDHLRDDPGAWTWEDGTGAWSTSPQSMLCSQIPLHLYQSVCSTTHTTLIWLGQRYAGSCCIAVSGTWSSFNTCSLQQSCIRVCLSIFMQKKKCQVSMTNTKYEEYSNVHPYHDNQPILQNWVLWRMSSLRVKWTQTKTHDGRVVINPSPSSLRSSSKT